MDPKLFDPAPPPGYKDDTPKPLPLAEEMRKIGEAFRVYAEACGGRYPPSRCTSAAMWSWPWPAGWACLTGRRRRNKRAAGPFAVARAGFREVQNIETYRPDVVYNGKTVGPRDKDKVLLRWKLDDGRYAVIYGDLHGETLTAGRLQTVEMR